MVLRLFSADCSPGSVVAVAGCLVRCSFSVIEVIFDAKPNDTKKNINEFYLWNVFQRSNSSVLSNFNSDFFSCKMQNRLLIRRIPLWSPI